MIELALPYPPTINHYYGQKRNGGKFIKTRGQLFRQEVSMIIKGANIQTLEGDLCITIHMYPPDKRKRDIDNINKALFDALEHAQVFINDSQITELHSIKRQPVKGGMVRVRLEKAVS